ncbi:tigger transposable element-derived protein 6-like [Leptopilina boulardi]|uniref:tigger transposable element-derived protein 6-like n=1 Tax=Leptopilina boulardi TaxID=63433 RepID=UPI0021F609A3|nr:tigger transposable element-derived protein 6-like [Leptopilina boulardi]
MSKRKLKVLSLSDKLKIVSEFESGKLRDVLTSEYGLSESTFYRIIREKDSIKSECFEGHGNIKRKRVVEFPDLEKCLLEWLKQVLDKNIPIDGPLLKGKAQVFAKKLGIQNFAASNGWLEGFKKRHNLVFKNKVGEIKSGDQDVCNEWTENLPTLLKEYDANNIYNADETALFFKCLPNKTFTFRGEDCCGGKQSKERLTVLHCANMTGTNKLPLLIIGKSKKPRCFKGVKTLPVDYNSNSKAWMTRNIFTEWLHKVNNNMKKKKTKILLFVDNCAAHSKLPKLTHVKIVFLPAHTTSQLQPLDQGVIHAFKRHYRTEVVKHTLGCIEKKKDTTINILSAMKFARKAWFAISDVTIKNCFKKAGFWNGERCEAEPIEVGPSKEEWESLVSDEADRINFEDFVRVDVNVVITEEQTDDDIVENCVRDTNDNGDDNDEEADENSTIQEISIPKLQEVLSALDKI